MTSWRSWIAKEAPLTRDNLVEEFFAEFPEMRPAYEADTSLYHDDEYGLIGHAFVGEFLTGLIIVPELERDDGSGRNPRLHKAFRFVERLLASPDDRVYDTAETGTCERITDPPLRERARPYLGRRAKKVLREIDAVDAWVLERDGPPWWWDDPETVADEEGTGNG